MKYNIVMYGNPVLREKAQPIDCVDEKIRQLAKDMLETMYASQGIGLAAEQIGRTERIFVVDVSPALEDDAAAPDTRTAMPFVFINPEITSAEGKQVGQEGCLSFPDVYVNVTRAEKVTVRFVNVDGGEETLEAEGLLSRAIQHELDHLNGVLIVDRMSPVQKVANAGKLKRIRKSA